MGRGIKINIVLIIGGIVAFIVILYFLLRDTPEKNLLRARKYHAMGQKFARKQEFDEARLNYEIAKTYRERAMKLKGGK